MFKFQVLCSETVIYRVEVEAESAEQAREIVDSGIIEFGEPVDGFNFEIDEVLFLETV
jgi:hypothetical protein